MKVISKNENINKENIKKSKFLRSISVKPDEIFIQKNWTTNDFLLPKNCIVSFVKYLNQVFPYY